MAATFNAEPLPAQGGATQALTRPAAATAGGTAATGGVDSASALGAHESAVNPHPQYETAAEVLAQIATHSGAADPHGDRAFATAAVATHTAAADPHGDRAFATAAVATHTAAADPHPQYREFLLPLILGDETTAITTGQKLTLRAPVQYRVLSVRGSLATAQTSGATFTVTMARGGVAMFGTNLTIGNGLRTSAATPPTIVQPLVVDDAELTVTVSQIGDGTARGLRLVLRCALDN